MIRFIDIRNQGTGERFAFWNTVYDCFINYDGDFAWTNWAEFEVSYETQKPDPSYPLDRFKMLCPKWTFNNDEDDIDQFYSSS